MSPTAKRALFQTPTRCSKRSKLATSMKSVMKVPKSMQPEMKQYEKSTLTTAFTGYAYSSIPTDMSQGDASDQFIGSKLRMARLRVNYDWSQLTLTEAVRVSVVIPKDPSTTPFLSNARATWDTAQFTVLHDMILPPDLSVSAGTFDVTGPINIEMTSNGVTCLRNNIQIYVGSNGNGTGLANDISYSIWFTG